MKTKLLIISTTFVLLFSACQPHTHVIGNGPQGNTEVSKRQIWVIALVPINEVDTKAMAGEATDYEITTKTDIVDLLVYGLTSGILTSRKVTVKK